MKTFMERKQHHWMHPLLIVLLCCLIVCIGFVSVKASPLVDPYFSGTVLDMQGNPQANVELIVQEGDQGTTKSIFTDSQGRYVVETSSPNYRFELGKSDRLVELGGLWFEDNRLADQVTRASVGSSN